MIRSSAREHVPIRAAWYALAWLAACSTAISACGGATGSHRTAARGHGTAAMVRPDVPVTPDNVQTALGHNSPELAVDPTDPRFVVMADRIDSPTYSCDLQVSGDGGRSWVAADPVPRLPAGAQRCYLPSVAFDRTGRLFYVFVGLHTRANSPMGVFLTSSTDRGAHFSTPRLVIGGQPFGVTMAIDPSLGSAGRIYLAWIQANSEPVGVGFPDPPNPVVSSYSDDGGRTFSPAVEVSDPRRLLVTAPTIAVGRDHAVHVLYYDLGDDQRDYHGLVGPRYASAWSLVLSSSYDEGAHFSASAVVAPRVVPTGRVLLVLTMPPAALAAGPGGELYVAWSGGYRGGWDVFLRRSPDAGRSWDPATRVSADPTLDGREQYLPQVSVAPGGRVDIIYYHRIDPADVLDEVYYTFSFDHGQTFAAPRVLDSQPFDSSYGAHYLIPYFTPGMVEIGGRLGLVSTDTRALAAWTDTRMSFGTLTPRYNYGPAAQDIYAAEIDFRTRA